MLDLTTIPADVLRARGEYSTVRAAHEDAKKELQILTGALAALAAKLLRRMQPDGDDVPDSVEDMLATARGTVDKIEAECIHITGLAQQRADLKPKAWSK